MALASRIPGERLTAGFARAADARYAISILQACGDGPVRASIEPVLDERGEIRLVILRIELEGVSRDRALSAITGAHGVDMTPAVGVALPGDPGDITAHSA